MRLPLGNRKQRKIISIKSSNRPKYNSKKKKGRLPGNILIRVRERIEDLNQVRASYQSANMSNCLESFTNEVIDIFGQ